MSGSITEAAGVLGCAADAAGDDHQMMQEKDKLLHSNGCRLVALLRHHAAIRLCPLTRGKAVVQWNAADSLGREGGLPRIAMLVAHADEVSCLLRCMSRELALSVVGRCS